VVPEDHLEEATMEMAEKIAAKNPFAVRTGKAGIYGMQDLPYHQALDYMGELFAALCSTEDAMEGVRAFQEKRDPVWKGK
jgi:enoyl-CoA hydratase/carnithine racemase